MQQTQKQGVRKRRCFALLGFGKELQWLGRGAGLRCSRASHHTTASGGSADGDPLGKDPQQRLGVSVVQPCLGARRTNVWLSEQKEEETAAGRCIATIPRLFFFFLNNLLFNWKEQIQDQWAFLKIPAQLH